MATPHRKTWRSWTSGLVLVSLVCCSPAGGMRPASASFCPSLSAAATDSDTDTDTDTASVVSDLRAWFERHRTRGIDFFEPLRTIPGAEPRYLDKRVLDEMEALFDRAAASESIEAAGVLADIATFHFTRTPEGELERADEIYLHRPAWVRQEAMMALASMRSAAVFDWVVEDLLGEEGGRLSALRRELGARVLGEARHEPALYALRAQARDRSERVRIAVLEALDAIGRDASIALLLPSLSDDSAGVRTVALELVRRRAAVMSARHRIAPPPRLAGRVAELLEDPSWWVRLSAAETLREIRDEDAVGPLIAALRREVGSAARERNLRVVDALHETLESLTGEEIAAEDTRGWREWWEAATEHGFRLGESPDDRYQPTFYGVTLGSRRILFVLDVSTSMDYPARPGKYGTATETKLQQVKRELEQTLSRLAPSTKFDILFFAGDVKRWQGRLVKAGPENVAAARAFVRAQTSRPATNLYGALAEALDLGAPGSVSSRVGRDVDSIVLLSDGWPSVGEFVEPEQVVGIVTAANRFSRTRIHTIEVEGMVERRGRPSIPFLEQLAWRNHGQYRRIELR